MPIVLGFLIGLLILSIIGRPILGEDGVPSSVGAHPLADVVDPGDPNVSSAHFDAALVQWGTDRPYAGSGPPGIHLNVRTDAPVIEWTVIGWANQTTPSTGPELCEFDTMFFSTYDWVYETDGIGGDGGTYASIPSTVPQRLSTGGDQCFLRIGALDWSVAVCIEGAPEGAGDVSGPPRGVYDGEDGRRHIDIWDRCVTKPFRVPG